MRVLMKRLIFVFGIILSIISVFYIRTSDETKNATDLVIFSFNRPLQLYALLESVQKYLKSVQETHIIYRASNEQFDRGYELVKQNFKNIHYHKQGANPTHDFKQLTLKAAFESSSSYIIFAVDDIVLKQEVDLAACMSALEKYNGYGFYLRLGTNLDNCYSWGSATQPLPPMKQEEETIFSWHFNQGKYDWIYPHTVDMTLYRKKDIESDLRVYTYHSPNKLEDIWNLRARAILTKKGLCYKTSKIVNMPLNRVQHDYNNRAMKEWSPESLLQKLLAGQKMDIAPLYCVNNRAAHMEYSPTFVNR